MTNSIGMGTLREPVAVLARHRAFPADVEGTPGQERFGELEEPGAIRERDPAQLHVQASDRVTLDLHLHRRVAQGSRSG